MAASIKETLSPLIKNSSARRLSLDWTSSLLSTPSPTSSNGRRKLSVPSVNFCSPSRPGGRRHSATFLNFSSPSKSQISLNKSAFTQPIAASPPDSPDTNSVESEFVVVLPPSPEETPRLSCPTPEKKQLERRWKRRKSSTSRFDFNDNFLSSVSLKCPVKLHPEIILGRGSFGTVVSGTYHGRDVAVKVIDMKCSKKRESLKGEENALILLPPHQHITTLIDIVHMMDEHKALVILERANNGNLLGHINDPDIPLDCRTVLRMSAEIASALSFCHAHSLLHLDVKPQNILLDIDGSTKLSDFGTCKRISELGQLKNFSQLEGTVAYTAPEIFRGMRPSDKSDVYSLGISLWQMYTREQPYMSESEHSVIYKVVAQGLRPKAVCSFDSSLRYRFPTATLENFKLLYEKCWSAQPETRPSMDFIYCSLEKMSQQSTYCNQQ